MKTLSVMLFALALAGCIFTKPKPIELCKSSPQALNNELQCTKENINNKAS